MIGAQHNTKTQKQRDGAPSRCFRMSKSLAEFAPRTAQIKSNLFFPAAHTSGKTLLALQVWKFCAEGAEIMRAAGCKPLKREPSEAGLVGAWQKYFFATLKQRDGAPSRCFSDGANHVWLQRRDLVFREASVICRHQVDTGAGFLRQHQGVVHDLHADLARVDQLSQR